MTSDHQRADHAAVVFDILHEFADRYRFEITPQVEDKFWTRFEHTPTAVLRAAATDWLDHEEFAPRGGRFADHYVTKHLRIAARVADPGNCPHCDHGWMDSHRTDTAVASAPTVSHRGMLNGPDEAYTVTYPPGVYPCPHCRQVDHERWRDTWIAEARRNAPVTSSTDLGYDPAAVIAHAKGQLTDLASLTRSADDL